MKVSIVSGVAVVLALWTSSLASAEEIVNGHFEESGIPGWQGAGGASPGHAFADFVYVASSGGNPCSHLVLLSEVPHNGSTSHGFVYAKQLLPEADRPYWRTLQFDAKCEKTDTSGAPAAPAFAHVTTSGSLFWEIPVSATWQTHKISFCPSATIEPLVAFGVVGVLASGTTDLTILEIDNVCCYGTEEDETTLSPLSFTSPLVIADQTIGGGPGTCSETQPECEDGCFCPDLNGDGQVDDEDLDEVNENWDCTGDCEGDVDCSGVVDVDDLWDVILNWGEYDCCD